MSYEYCEFLFTCSNAAMTFDLCLSKCIYCSGIWSFSQNNKNYSLFHHPEMDNYEQEHGKSSHKPKESQCFLSIALTEQQCGTSAKYLQPHVIKKDIITFVNTYIPLKHTADLMFAIHVLLCENNLRNHFLFKSRLPLKQECINKNKKLLHYSYFKLHRIQSFYLSAALREI